VGWRLSLPPNSSLSIKNPESGNGRAGKPTFAIRLEGSGAIPSDSDLTINGGGNFNIRNSNGWVYNGTITGNDTGTIFINEGADVELAGDISRVTTITSNYGTPNANLSGDISGGTGILVSGANVILTLSRISHTAIWSR
jgi:hypothetical protein